MVCVSGCSSPSPAREVGGRLSEGKQVGLLTGSGAGPDPGTERREAAAVMGRGASRGEGCRMDPVKGFASRTGTPLTEGNNITEFREVEKEVFEG